MTFEILPVPRCFGDRCRNERDAVTGDLVIDDDVQIDPAVLVRGGEPATAVDDHVPGGDRIVGYSS